MELSFVIIFNELKLDDLFNKFFSQTKNQNYKYEKIYLNDFPKMDYNAMILDYKSYIFMQKNGLIIYTNNMDSYNDIHNFFLHYQCSALIIRIFDSCYYLEYLTNSIKRVIYSLKDGEKWKFYQDGPQQPFEENDEYNERGATKKFNFMKLKKFCKNMGIDFADSEFFKPVSDVFYIFRTNKVLEKKIVTYKSRVQEKYEEIMEDTENSNVLLNHTQQDNDGNVLCDEICEVQWTNREGVREYYVIDSTNEKILKRLKKIKRSAKKKGVKIVIEYQVSPDFAH